MRCRIGRRVPLNFRTPRPPSTKASSTNVAAAVTSQRPPAVSPAAGPIVTNAVEPRV